MVVHIQSTKTPPIFEQLTAHPFMRHLRHGGKVLALSGFGLGMTAAPAGAPKHVPAEAQKVAWRQLEDPSKMMAGIDFQVTTAGNGVPAVAMDDEGNFVVVWSGVSAQRYDGAGNPVGGVIAVNAGGSAPDVAMDADGDFVVVFQGTDSDGNGIFARRYDNTGSAVSSAFQVNTVETNAQDAPSVAVDAAGNFVVAWESNLQDGSQRGVYAQRYNSAGSTVGSEFRVNTNTGGQQRAPSVAMDDSGDFLIAWFSVAQDGSQGGIYGQRYDSVGSTVGSEFLVNTTTAGNQINPSVAMDADGNAVVAWTSNGQDGSQHGVYFQRYNSGGSTVGAETRANDNTAGVQANVSVAMDADGDFLVTWQSATGESPAGGGYGIFGQFYSFVTAAAPESASKILAEFQVNNQTEGNQLTPAAAMIDPGEYVVVYDNLSGFGGTRLGPTSLPVELTRFDAEMTDNAALLTWLTATETDNAGFELQQATRRADAEPAWKPLVWIDGVGTTTEAQAYTYRVEDLAPGRHMFRLKQVDFDGEFEYSPIVEVEVEVPGTHVLSAAYPNPFNPSTQFELVLAREQHVQIAVFDLQGRQVRMLQSGVLSENTQHVIRFDADQLPGGLYVIRVVGEGFVETRSVTLVK